MINITSILNILVMIAIIVSAIYAVTAKNILASVISLGVTGAFVALGFILLTGSLGKEGIIEIYYATCRTIVGRK